MIFQFELAKAKLFGFKEKIFASNSQWHIINALIVQRFFYKDNPWIMTEIVVNVFIRQFKNEISQIKLLYHNM